MVLLGIEIVWCGVVLLVFFVGVVGFFVVMLFVGVLFFSGCWNVMGDDL